MDFGLGEASATGTPKPPTQHSGSIICGPPALTEPAVQYVCDTEGPSVSLAHMPICVKHGLESNLLARHRPVVTRVDLRDKWVIVWCKTLKISIDLTLNCSIPECGVCNELSCVCV